jgi:ribosomal protein L14E/L6E/L27E
MSESDRRDYKSSFESSLRLNDSEFESEILRIAGGAPVTDGKIAEINANLSPGDVVLNISGRDRGRFYFIRSVADGYVYLTDGRTRKLDAAKKKKVKHVLFVASPSYKLADNIKKLDAGELEVKDKITNKQVRAALRDYYKTRSDIFK